VKQAGIAMTDPAAVTESSKMSDLLSAASLLLTVLGIVFGAWYPEIVNALAAAVDEKFDDRGAVRRTVRTALYGKALPLALAATILTALFLPDALAIVRGAYSAFGALGWGAFGMYDAVEAAFCLVVALAGLLAVYLMSLAYRLRAKLWTINTP
jgi:cytochrome c biogenesis factor